MNPMMLLQMLLAMGVCVETPPMARPDGKVVVVVVCPVEMQGGVPGERPGALPRQEGDRNG